MPLPFFFHSDLSAASINQQLDEATSKHVIQVLRMKAGDQLQLTNGKGLLAITEVTEPHKKACTVTIKSTTNTSRVSARKTGIAISPVKNSSRFEWFLEKATELGAADIYPLICQRTEREHFRFDRMNAICISAMLQSQQTWLPVLHQPLSFNSLVEHMPANGNYYIQKWIAHCTDLERQSLVESLKKSMTDSLVLIGPEGDFTNEEIALAIKNGYQPVALGNSRLRTETAGMVAAALLLLG